MSAWSTLATCWRISQEYPAAFDAARDAFMAGQPIAACVRAFAERTENRIDDRLADELVAALTVGIDYAHKAATACARVAAVIEEHGPKLARDIDTGARAIEAVTPRVVGTLRTGAAEVAQRSEQIRELAARVGVIAVRAATRLAAMR